MKKGWKNPKSLSQTFTAVFLSTHTISNCAPFHPAVICKFPNASRCKLGEEDWQCSQLDLLVRPNGEGPGDITDGQPSISKWCDAITSQVRIPAQKQPREVGKAEHQCVMAGKVLNKRTFTCKLRTLFTQGMFRWPAPGSRTPQSRAQHGFLAGLSAKHFKFTGIQQKGEFSGLKLGAHKWFQKIVLFNT